MKTLTLYTMCLLILFTSCKNKDSSSNGKEEKDKTTEMILADNSRTALDWEGVYKGTLPCADCEGILTEIRLNKDLSYVKGVKYLGKSDAFMKTNGTFDWDDSGSTIILNEAAQNSYKVGENVLMALDQNGNEITGALSENYRLKKIIMDSRITEKYWRLIELNGEKISTQQDQKEIHLILKDKDSLVTGFSGCNSFSGKYVFNEDHGKLRFTKMKSTLMACDNMETEAKFNAVLAKVDTYTLKNDTLSITKARMAPLAKFQAIYSE